MKSAGVPNRENEKLAFSTRIRAFHYQKIREILRGQARLTAHRSVPKSLSLPYQNNQLMRHFTLLVLIGGLAFSCGKPGQENHEHHADGDGSDPNQALYNEVMDIHDEVMPKMEDLYKLKKKMQEEIGNTSNLAEERKKELEGLIAKLDSANMSMMDWMHEFNPLPDSADQEDAREYLENEMERVKKVREKMLESIEAAKNKVKPD